MEASGRDKQNKCYIATQASGEGKQNKTSHIAAQASGKDKIKKDDKKVPYSHGGIRQRQTKRDCILCPETRFKTDVCMIVIFESFQKTDLITQVVCIFCERHAFFYAHMYEM